MSTIEAKTENGKELAETLQNDEREEAEPAGDGISLSTEWFNVVMIGLAPLLGFACIVVYACSAGNGTSLNVIGKLILLSLVSMIFGGLFGFLFGIPKTLQSNNATQDKTRYTINTNLEQISDWLTKIIVGIGLIQINKLSGYINTLQAYFQRNWGTDYLKDVGSVSVCVIGYFLLLGFLMFYLYTRINLTALLKKYSSGADLS